MEDEDEGEGLLEESSASAAAARVNTFHWREGFFGYTGFGKSDFSRRRQTNGKKTTTEASDAGLGCVRTHLGWSTQRRSLVPTPALVPAAGTHPSELFSKPVVPSSPSRQDEAYREIVRGLIHIPDVICVRYECNCHYLSFALLLFINCPTYCKVFAQFQDMFDKRCNCLFMNRHPCDSLPRVKYWGNIQHSTGVCVISESLGHDSEKWHTHTHTPLNWCALHFSVGIVVSLSPPRFSPHYFLSGDIWGFHNPGQNHLSPHSRKTPLEALETALVWQFPSSDSVQDSEICTLSGLNCSSVLHHPLNPCLKSELTVVLDGQRSNNRREGKLQTEVFHPWHWTSCLTRAHAGLLFCLEAPEVWGLDLREVLLLLPTLILIFPQDSMVALRLSVL